MDRHPGDLGQNPLVEMKGAPSGADDFTEFCLVH
jgi:hypothetical protein